ncbi:Hypothetical predicted protein [Pelobates cultripes]|uniref:Helix-turn-helix domain-containing protein n=1 Tax=Pelobates cultripes TaxID=61616 RepID=A0AAD1SGI5_PELCU|nr:Hypothetical predicted protein [Pelobates cultripes]
MYANAYMYVYEKEHILTKYTQYIQGYCRYINDLVIIWNGSLEMAHQMVIQLNQLSSPIRMTANIDVEQVQFLDLSISIGDGKLEYSMFTKPTDRNTLLHYQSAHPVALKNSLPKAQYLRVIRNNLKPEVMEQQLQAMTTKFMERGYPQPILQKALQDARHARSSEKASSPTKLVFPMQFHQSATLIYSAIKKNWKMLSSDDTLPKIFKEPPLICYKRNRNLKDMLVHTDPIKIIQRP